VVLSILIYALLGKLADSTARLLERRCCRRCCPAAKSNASRSHALWSPGGLAFDEPLGALVALTRISMQRLIERVWIDQGFSAIMVTHDVAEAVTLADRVLMIQDGAIVLDRRIHLTRTRAALRGCGA